MTTVQNFRDEHDGNVTKPLKQATPPRDLVDAESYNLLKLNSPMTKALDAFIIGTTEVEPKTAARVNQTARALEAAPKEQDEADALAVADVIGEGIDGFAKLADALDEVDVVAEAERNHAQAVRLHNGVKASNKGHMTYLNRLVGREYREDFLNQLDHAWAGLALKPTNQTTLGELAEMEGRATEGRAILGRLMLWAEHQNPAGSLTQADTKLVREALKSEDWDRLPTFERVIEAHNAEAVAAEEEASEEVRRTKAEADAANKRYAQQAAQARRGIFGGMDSQNSDEDLVGVTS